MIEKIAGFLTREGYSGLSNIQIKYNSDVYPKATLNAFRQVYKGLFSNSWTNVQEGRQIEGNYENRNIQAIPDFALGKLENLKMPIGITMAGLTQQMQERDEELAKRISEEAGLKRPKQIEYLAGDYISPTFFGKAYEFKDVQPLDLSGIQAQIAAQFDASSAK